MSAPISVQIGKKLARLVFEKRGNHSEAHITERELASIIEVGVETLMLKTEKTLRADADEPQFDFNSGHSE